MTIKLDKCFNKMTVTLSDPKCKAEMKDGTLTVTSKLEECGMKMEDGSDKIVFKNFLNVRMDHENSRYDNLMLMSKIRVRKFHRYQILYVRIPPEFQIFFLFDFEPC